MADGLEDRPDGDRLLWKFAPIEPTQEMVRPDDNPPVPCPRKYALSECRAAAAPPVREDRVRLAQTRYDTCKYDLQEVLRAGFREMRFVHADIAADEMIDAILSLRVQPGADEREAITRLIYEADSPSDPKDAWKEAQRITDVILSTIIQHGTSND